MRLLVGGVLSQQRLPAPRPAQQVRAQLRQPLAGLLGPRLVEVVRQQHAGPGVEHPGRGAAIPVTQDAPGGILELRGVHLHPVVGQEQDQLPPQRHPGGRLAEGAAREVRGLVQPRARLGDVGVRPERVDHLLAVQPPVGHECEELDQRSRPAPAPGLVRDRHAGDLDPEPSEQADRDVHAALLRAKLTSR